MKNCVEMRSFLRRAGAVLCLLSAGLASAAPAASPEKIERGRYLANQVAACMSCHSERNWAFYAGPVTPGTEGKGAKLDYLGIDRYSANITPAGIGGWSDKEVARALTEGIGKGGQPVHDFLTDHEYRQMAADDVDAVVAYLRTLPAIANEVPKAPVPAGKKAAPHTKPYKPLPRPNPADTVAQGKYLVALADCQLCHNENFAGGKKFQIPGRDPVLSLNISPAPGTATGGKPRDTFIGRFKAFASDGARRLRAPAGNPSSVMPWTELSRMSEDDLGAIYDYLKTVAAVPNPPTPTAGGK
jgi:mono/diheme cytochrome c family protein